jgi:CubicO group peptidase (beta-lactamase class C family)
MRLPGLLAALLLALLPVPAAAASGHLAEWSDAIVGRAVAEGRASGAAVAIVDRGETVFLKAYGEDRGRPVTAEGTPFSIGSVSKSFTATAIAQLLESGRIASLDDPANRYLKRVHLPARGGREITVRNLLTHRAGFDDSTYGLATPVPVKVPLPPEAIEKRLPPQVRRAGDVSVYSNNGYAILGLLIEDITGELYPDYIARHVFGPLGMAKSFVRTRPDQPIALPTTLHTNGKRTPVPQTWAYHPYIAPSAAIVSTAEDMARFAAAQIAAERAGAPGIANAETTKLMHSRMVANAPDVSGFGMSFVVSDWNGVRIVENAGSGPGFQANFILLPGRDRALVALVMGDYAGPSAWETLVAKVSGKTLDRKASLNMFAIRRSFLERELGVYAPPTVAGPLPPPAQFAGLYRAARRPATTPEALTNPGAVIDARAGAGNTLTINGISGYRQYAPGRFFRADVTQYVPDAGASDLYAFATDSGGKVRYAATHVAIEMFAPARFSPAQARLAGGVGLVLSISGLVAIFWRPRRRLHNVARWAAFTLGLGALVAMLIPVAGTVLLGNPVFAWAFADTRLFAALTVAGNLIVASTLVLTLAVLAGLRGQGLGWGRYLWLAALAVGGAFVTAALFYFNLVGWHLP